MVMLEMEAVLRLSRLPTAPNDSRERREAIGVPTGNGHVPELLYSGESQPWTP